MYVVETNEQYTPFCLSYPSAQNLGIFFFVNVFDPIGDKEARSFAADRNAKHGVDWKNMKSPLLATNEGKLSRGSNHIEQSASHAKKLPSDFPTSWI